MFALSTNLHFALSTSLHTVKSISKCLFLHGIYPYGLCLDVLFLSFLLFVGIIETSDHARFKIAAAVSMNSGFRVRILIIIINNNKCSHALQMLLFSAVTI